MQILPAFQPATSGRLQWRALSEPGVTDPTPEPVGGGASAAPLAGGASSIGGAAAPPGLAQHLDEDTFLKLLVAELRHQDPMDPVDSAQMMTQLAQFSVVDQLNKLNETVAYSAGAQGLAAASALLGREVTAFAPDGTQAIGIVTRVAVRDGEPVLAVGDQEVYLADVISISDPFSAGGETDWSPVGVSETTGGTDPAGSAAGQEGTDGMDPTASDSSEAAAGDEHAGSTDSGAS